MRPTRAIFVWCILWVLFLAFAHSNAGFSFDLFFVCYGISAVWALAWFIRLLVHAWRSRHEALKPAGFAYWAIEPCAFAIAIFIAVSDTPFYLRFMASRPALTRYVNATSVADMDRVHWIGLYLVFETEVLPDGVVRFITSESGLDHAGFAYSPRSSPPVIGEDSYTKLPFAEGWYHWHRSW